MQYLVTLEIAIYLKFKGNWISWDLFVMDLATLSFRDLAKHPSQNSNLSLKLLVRDGVIE